jgi:hypothetical protein
VETTPRPTAPTVGVPFSEVLAGGARTLARTAGAAVHSLPGSPIMAVALRGTGGISTALSTSGLQGPAPGLGGVNIYGPGGPSPVAGTATGSTSGTAADGSAAGTNDPSISSALAQDQEMNLYYLQIQEQVNAQNRTYSALSNVIEVEHNTAKTAIGNIH